MTARRYSLSAVVSTDNPAAIRPALESLLPPGSVTKGPGEGEFRVKAETEGSNARELNRGLLTELRRVEKRTRIRSEWTSEGVTERFFDYVPKGKRSA